MSATVARPAVRHRGDRASVLELLARVGRDNSDATVLFHSSVAELMGLHPTDYKVLGMLDRRGPMSAGEIARTSGLAPASVTELIVRLERKRFVRSVRDPQDRRRVLVEPSAARVESARQIFGSTRRSLARLFERYSDHELAIIADFLGRNAERLHAETTKLVDLASHRSLIR